MAITMRRTFVPLTQLALVTAEDMAAVGQYVRQRILERTARGVDASGQPFQPYSARYAEAKQAALGSSGRVDLQVSGGMLNAIAYEASPHKVTLYFSL